MPGRLIPAVAAAATVVGLLPAAASAGTAAGTGTGGSGPRLADGADAVTLTEPHRPARRAAR